jgi:hypothetical protein
MPFPPSLPVAGVSPAAQLDRFSRSPGGARRLGTGAVLLLCLGIAAPALPAGFPNAPQVPGTLLSGLLAPNQGRTAILAYHNGILFSVPEAPASLPGSDLQVRTWDLADPLNPAELATWGSTPMPINAHGYLQSGPYLVLGANWPPEAPWSFRANAAPGSLTRTTYPDLLCAGVRGCLFQPFFIGDTWWSYGAIGGLATIERNGAVLGTWDHLGLTGVIGHPFLIGNLLIFASDQSRTGVATYDVSDPANPVLLDVLTSGGPGGYWPEVWGGDGKLYVVLPYRDGGNGIQVVDATDPTALRLVADTPLPGAQAMYAQFQDEFAFIGDHKVDLRTFQSVLDLHGATVPRTNDGGIGIDTSQFALPLGNLLVTGGVGDNQGMAIWAHQAAPDTRGPSVGFHIPRAGQANYPAGSPITLLIHETLETHTIVNGASFIVRPVGGAAIAGRLTFAFDDILTFTPNAPLAANTTYEVVLPAGGIRDAAGNGMVGYSFTFSTGATVNGNTPPAVTAFDATPYPAAPGTAVAFAAAAVDPQAEAVEYRFDFGDGSPKTAWGGAGAAHAFAAAGHYRASVQARDPHGAIATRTRVVTVALPPAGPRPAASAPASCDAAGRRVWAVNPDHGTVAALDADSGSLLVETPVCAEPRALARAAGGELWVACGDDRIRILDGSGTAIGEIPTGYGSAPAGIVASSSGATLYVALQGRGEVRRIDAASRQTTAALALSPGPRALALSADGARLLVTRFLSDRDWGEVWDVATAGLTLTRTIRLPKLGGDANRDTTASGRGTPNQLAAIAITPDGAHAWVAATKPNVERGLLYGPDLDSDNTVRATLVELALGPGTAVRAIDLDNSDSPSALSFSPLGDYLFVTLQGDDELVVLDAFELESAAGLGSLVTRLATGAAPQGVCADAPSGRIFVANFLGRSTSVFEAGDFYGAGEIQIPSTEVASAGSVGGEPLPAQVLAGKRLFYHARDPRMSAEGYLSCATCHVGGGDDGRVWDFTGRGEGLRRTVPLRGRAGTGQGNAHWSANFDEIQDFEGDIRNAFGGTGFMDDDDFAATAAPLGPPKAGLSPELDQLAAYVSSLGRSSVARSPHRNADGSMTAAGAAGRTLFRSLPCAGCHRGPDFTDSTLGGETLHDVGTLRTTSGGRLGDPLTGIDTPTLLGLFTQSRYLHDGSAGSLEAVFTVAGGTVLQAETATPSAGAQIVSNYVELNNDDTVRGRAYAALGPNGSRITFGGVDGGTGGVGAIELRFSSSGASQVSVAVNGAGQTLNLPPVGNSPSWRHTHWRTARAEGVTFAAGAANTIQITGTSAFPNLSVDEITVTRPNELQLAAAHRGAGALSPAQRAELAAYLLQLDGTPEDNPGGELFSDGFGSGDTTAWSEAHP